MQQSLTEEKDNHEQKMGEYRMDQDQDMDQFVRTLKEKYTETNASVIPERNVNFQKIQSNS